ncbi:MAG: GHKL domain-containing protein [Rhizobiales bacterium]|nr:GHKL domain-containing protein [Hyphomicrobiales bacterium]
MQIFKFIKLNFLILCGILILMAVLTQAINNRLWLIWLILSLFGAIILYAYQKSGQIKAAKTLDNANIIYKALPLDIETLVEAQVFPTLILSETGNILYLNQALIDAFANIANDRAKQNLIGQHFSTLIRAPQILALYEQVQASKKPSQFNFTISSNIERHFWLNIAPIITNDKTFFSFTLRDLTKDQKIEQMRADFVANASHELRTPLASISGFIETLQGPAQNDKKVQAKFLGIMQEQALRMTRLIDDLLSLSKIEMNIHSKPQDIINLNEVIEHCIISQQPLAEDKKIILSFENKVKNAHILGDKDQLIQLVNNLLDNAFKYGIRKELDESKVIINLSENTEKQTIILSIKDFGRGIPKRDLPRLTERFYRVSNMPKTNGTGLGLAIVKHIAQRHNAKISFKSQLDKGTNVEVCFNKIN